LSGPGVSRSTVGSRPGPAGNLRDRPPGIGLLGIGASSTVASQRKARCRGLPVHGRSRPVVASPVGRGQTPSHSIPSGWQTAIDCKTAQGQRAGGKTRVEDQSSKFRKNLREQGVEQASRAQRIAPESPLDSVLDLRNVSTAGPVLLWGWAPRSRPAHLAAVLRIRAAEWSLSVVRQGGDGMAAGDRGALADAAADLLPLLFRCWPPMRARLA